MAPHNEDEPVCVRMEVQHLAECAGKARSLHWPPLGGLLEPVEILVVVLGKDMQPITPVPSEIEGVGDVPRGFSDDEARAPADDATATRAAHRLAQVR